MPLAHLVAIDHSSSPDCLHHAPNVCHVTKYIPRMPHLTGLYPAAPRSAIEQPIACMVQQIYEGGLFHPSVTTSITGPLFTNNFSTSAVLQQNASIEAGYICSCGEFYNNPCREEIRAVGSLMSCPAVCVSAPCMCAEMIAIASSNRAKGQLCSSYSTAST